MPASTIRCEVSWLPNTIGAPSRASQTLPGRVSTVIAVVHATVGHGGRREHRLDQIVDRGRGDEARRVDRPGASGRPSAL